MELGDRAQGQRLVEGVLARNESDVDGQTVDRAVAALDLAAAVLLLDGRSPLAMVLSAEYARWPETRVVLADTYRVPAWNDAPIARDFAIVSAPVSDPSRFRDDVGRLVEVHEVDVVVSAFESQLFLSENGSGTLDAVVRSAETSRLLHDKAAFSDVVDGLGLLTPKRVSVSRTTNGPVVGRLRFGRAGVGQQVFGSGVDLSHLHPDVWVVTAHHDGADVSTWSVALDGELILHVAYVRDRGRERQAAGSVVVRRVDLPESARIARQVASAVGITGGFGLDLLVTPAGEVMLLECNPRLTPGLLLAVESTAKALRGETASVVSGPHTVMLPARTIGRMTRCWRPIDDVSFDRVDAHVRPDR